MGPTAGSAHALRNEINVTPLVDVCLVLLIIFMVVMPLLNEEVPVRLPYGANPDPRPQGEGQLRLSIAWDSPRVVFVGGDTSPIPLAALRDRLEELRRRKPWSEVVVRADRRLTYGDVRKVLRSLNEAGIRELSLVVDRAISPRAQD